MMAFLTIFFDEARNLRYKAVVSEVGPLVLATLAHWLMSLRALSDMLFYSFIHLYLSIAFVAIVPLISVYLWAYGDKDFTTKNIWLVVVARLLIPILIIFVFLLVGIYIYFSGIIVRKTFGISDPTRLGIYLFILSEFIVGMGLSLFFISFVEDLSAYKAFWAPRHRYGLRLVEKGPGGKLIYYYS